MLYKIVPQEIGNTLEELGLVFKGGRPLVVWSGKVWARIQKWPTMNSIAV